MEPEPSPVHPFDATLGIDASGLITGDQLRSGPPGPSAARFITAYYGIAPSILRALLDLWQTHCHPPLPLDHYTFVDIGAGKGRALLVAAEAPFREVVGVELTPTMATVARANLAAAQSRPNQLLAPLRLVEGDALTTPFPTGPLLLFLFNPFEAPAVRRLLRRLIQQSATPSGAGTEPRPTIDILYANAEHRSIFARDPHLTTLWEGRVPMSSEDHIADLKEIATQLDYGSTGDELCAIFRLTGRQP